MEPFTELSWWLTPGVLLVEWVISILGLPYPYEYARLLQGIVSVIVWIKVFQLFYSIILKVLRIAPNQERQR